MNWFRRHYGAGPGHLVLLLASFAFAGYISTQIAQVPAAAHIAVWFLGAVVFHDLVLWPAYAAADRIMTSWAWLSRHRKVRTAAVPWVNHIRVPAVISGVLLAVSFPLVFNWAGSTYRSATGLSPLPYTTRWIVITAVLFGTSAVVYLVRLALVRVRSRG